MIYITGDTHSNFSRFEEKNFPVQKEMTKDDYVIICGDFGGVWTFEEEKIYKYRKIGASFRIRNFSWWDLELPTEEEMENGILVIIMIIGRLIRNLFCYMKT